MFKPTSQVNAQTVSTSADLTHEEIATRAYEHFLRRGFGEHDALTDWLEAERALRGQLRRRVDTPECAKPKKGGSR